MHHPQTRYLDARVEIIGEVATTTPDEIEQAIIPLIQ